MKIAHICFLDSSTGSDLTTVFLICFTNTCKVTYDFIQSPRSLSVCAAPTQRAQVNEDCWTLNIQVPTHPDLAPCCMARYRPDTGQIQGLSATLGKLQRLSKLSRKWAKRLVSENVKGKKKNNPTYRGMYLVQYSNYKSHRHTIPSFTS